jgi:hypothetical protein
MYKYFIIFNFILWKNTAANVSMSNDTSFIETKITLKTKE